MGIPDQSRTEDVPSRKGLFGLLAISLVLKLAIWWVVAASDPSRFFAGDSVSYHNSARALVEAGAFAVSPEQPETPQTLRTPGYPAFLAAVYALFGPRPAPAIVAQILLSLATIALVWKLAAERWSARTAAPAACLMTLDLASFGHSLYLLSETLFTFLLCGVLYSAQHFARGSQHRWVFGLGLGLALATLVRPVAYYLVLPLVAWIAIAAWRPERAWRRAAAACALFALPWTLLIGGWHLRNAQKTGIPIFCSIEGLNLLYYRGAGIMALRDGIDIGEARKRLGQGRYQELHPETRGWSPERLSQRYQKEGLALMLGHPLLFAQLEARGLAATFLGTGEHTVARLLGIPLPTTGPLGDLRRLDLKTYVERWLLGRPLSLLIFALALGYLLILYTGAARWLLFRAREITLWDLCAWGIFLYLALISAGPEAYHRFRVPLTPILCLYAAAALRPPIHPAAANPPAVTSVAPPRES